MFTIFDFIFKNKFPQRFILSPLKQSQLQSKIIIIIVLIVKSQNISERTEEEKERSIRIIQAE